MSRCVPFEECKPPEIMAKLVDKLTVTGGARKHIQSLRRVWCDKMDELSGRPRKGETHPEGKIQSEGKTQSDMEVINQIVKENRQLYDYFYRVVEAACQETKSYQFPRNPEVKNYIDRLRERHHEWATSDRPPEDDQTEQTGE